jgi:hypothetical protein
MSAVEQLGPTAWHMVFLAKRQEGVTPADVERVCFMPLVEAKRRLDGLVQLGHLVRQGKSYHAAKRRQAAKPRAPRATEEATSTSPRQSPPAVASATLKPVGELLPVEKPQAKGGPAAWRPARKAPPAATVVPLPGVPPTVHIPLAQPASEPVIPPGLEVRRCPAPTFDPRYQIDPASRPFGAGFSACGIGRDVTTGKAWR